MDKFLFWLTKRSLKKDVIRMIGRKQYNQSWEDLLDNLAHNLVYPKMDGQEGDRLEKIFSDFEEKSVIKDLRKDFYRVLG